MSAREVPDKSRWVTPDGNEFVVHEWLALGVVVDGTFTPSPPPPPPPQTRWLDITPDGSECTFSSEVNARKWARSMGGAWVVQMPPPDMDAAEWVGP